MMENLKPKQMRNLFYAIEVNLLLWLSLGGGIWSSGTIEEFTKHISIAGFIVAALLQHWGYHNLYKPYRKQKKSNQQVDPIVTTPVDEVEAQSTQGHP